jgi:putative thioredoxin
MASEHVIDVTEATFDHEVVERSHQVPVLVDFWASWCAPCRMLTPVLEKVVSSLNGTAILAKVDTEANPGLSYRFGIQGIPAVKLFRGGRVAGEFVGFRPEPEVFAFVRAFLPTEADRLTDEAVAAAGDGRIDEATALLQQALEQDPRQPRALLALAEIRSEEGALDEAEDLYQRVAGAGPEEALADRGLAELRIKRLAADLGDPDAARLRASDAPDDVEARYALGVHLAAKRRYVEAMDELLRAAVSLKTRERAREAMTSVFAILGPDEDVVREYRTKLARLLF